MHLWIIQRQGEDVEVRILSRPLFYCRNFPFKTETVGNSVQRNGFIQDRMLLPEAS
jgi:hypothetical protein